MWLVPWSTNQAVKLKPVPKCATPDAFAGTSLKSLIIGTDFHCETPSQPILEMKPDQDQVIY